MTKVTGSPKRPARLAHAVEGVATRLGVTGQRFDAGGRVILNLRAAAAALPPQSPNAFPSGSNYGEDRYGWICTYPCCTSCTMRMIAPVSTFTPGSKSALRQ
jgi:hypothetical protein